MKVDKYVSVFNIGLQNTFVYRWNYFLRALFGLIPLAGTVFLWRAIFQERGGGLGLLPGNRGRQDRHRRPRR